jgi:hypothetical protein
MIPRELAQILDRKRSESWSGTLSLNLKDGCVLSIGITETIRIPRETHESHATTGGGSHGRSRIPER